MCGILGVFSPKFEKFEYEKAVFEKALASMSHRGPDGSGIEYFKSAIMGHSRLKILDLSSASSQPMLSFDKRFCLVFNGEIYNYIELRDELCRKYSVKFRSTGDTEVLLLGLIHEGVRFLDKCNGMFAFSFYDIVKEEMIIARDRFGIKPLYYSQEGDILKFSSEVPPLLEILKKRKSVNMSAVSSYLSFRYPICNDTFFEGVSSLAPGHFMLINKKEIKIKKYYEFESCYFLQDEDRGEDFYLNEVLRLLSDAVSLRMRSDVPYGAFLSGGVDSSLIVALMSKLLRENKGRINTYTIGFPEEGYNEHREANLTASKYQTNHHALHMGDEEYFSITKELIKKKGSPLSVPNEIPLFMMSKELKKEITVVLSGEGADEIFMGYGRIFRSPLDFNRYNSEGNDGLKQSLLMKFRKEDFETKAKFFYENYCYIKAREKKKIFNLDNVDVELIEEELFSQFEPFFRDNGLSFENQISYTFSQKHLQGLLMRVDSSTMQASVEARVPFVDHRLVEFVAQIPLKYKLRWISDESELKAQNRPSWDISEKLDRPKHILKELGKGLVVDEVLNRVKQGFPVPLHKWLGGDMNGFARDILLSECSERMGVWDMSYLKKNLDKSSIESNHSEGLKIWMMLNFNIFYESFLG
ncbi:asparagine synthase (glutamine-hydrolyzing) [Halobacteriovorax marinus]|nr:asparagine synthase (glutamine-hydrolyzing) [Halobacteriovorax marinus]